MSRRNSARLLVWPTVQPEQNHFRRTTSVKSFAKVEKMKLILSPVALQLQHSLFIYYTKMNYKSGNSHHTDREGPQIRRAFHYSEDESISDYEHMDEEGNAVNLVD